MIDVFTDTMTAVMYAGIVFVAILAVWAMWK